DARDRVLGHVVVEEAGPVGYGFPRSQAVERLEVLGQDAHAFPDAAISGADVLSEHASLPGGRVAQSLEDLDGGRLAGAVGAEEGEHLAGAHVKVDPVDGRDGGIPLDAPADLG